MLETYYVGVYWGARQETAAECARRLARFLQELAACDASFRQWYQPGRAPRGEPGLALPADDPRELEAFLLRGRNRADSDGRVIEELGFSGSIWNGRKNAALVNLACGGSSPHVSNVCVMDLPAEGEPFERLVQVPTLVQVLTCMVNAWEPEWGVATSHPLSERIVPRGHRGASAGWLTYSSRRRGTVPPLPAPVRIEPVGAQGTLVIVTPERPTAHEPEHVALLSRVHERLDRAGLLHPLCP
jgi:hypothetical protein